MPVPWVSAMIVPGVVIVTVESLSVYSQAPASLLFSDSRSSKVLQ